MTTGNIFIFSRGAQQMEVPFFPWRLGPLGASGNLVGHHSRASSRPKLPFVLGSSYLVVFTLLGKWFLVFFVLFKFSLGGCKQQSVFSPEPIPRDVKFCRHPGTF